MFMVFDNDHLFQTDEVLLGGNKRIRFNVNTLMRSFC